jgi:hypothetical protein
MNTQKILLIALLLVMTSVLFGCQQQGSTAEMGSESSRQLRLHNTPSGIYVPY